MLTQFTSTFVDLLKTNYRNVPLPWFTLLGSFIEEIIAPIPSPLVLTLAGSLAASQNRGLVFLVLISITGAFGKTIASYIIYVLTDKAEDFILNKAGRFLGITHKQIESAGKYLNKGIRDGLLITFLRAFPVIPTIPVSIACGLVKINVKTYLASTFIGTMIRNLFYISVGYTGVQGTEKIITKMEDYEIVVYVVLIVIIVLILGYMYFQPKKEKQI